MIFLADVWHSIPDAGHWVLLAAGLGFVVFFHELGHFLAAKYCGVQVDQFAVGFGSAIVAWRKGIGFRRGTTTPEVENRIDQYWEQHRVADAKTDAPPTSQQMRRAMAALGIGETEYRLNWIPLGGYVKMLGQDDLSPETASDDPRSYLNKPIRSRMLIVSAGVLMNVLLAAIGFMIVFLMGLSSPPAEVGGVLNGSPASFAQTDDGIRAPLQVGDRILNFDGKRQQGFSTVALTVALVREGQAIPMEVRRRDGRVEDLHVTPTRAAGDTQGFLSIGIMPPLELSGPEKADKVDPEMSDPALVSADAMAVRPGETITSINGHAAGSTDKPADYWMLDQAIADSGGQPVIVTIQSADGAIRTATVLTHFQVPFGREDWNFAGMTPRARVDLLMPDSPAKGKVRPGDVIAAVKPADQPVINNPSPQALRDAINAAGQLDKSIVLTLVDPDGTTRQTDAIVPTVRLADDRRGLSVQLGCDEQNAVVAAVEPNSSAAAAGIQPGWVISSVNGQKVDNWFQIRAALASAVAGHPVSIEAATPSGPATVSLSLSPDEIDATKFMTFTTDLTMALRDRTELRQTSNPLIAAAWGAAETRDSILQFYVTIRRMFAGSISYKMAMGPVGIVRFGAATAARGANWLVWFLAMISANLAVANFLPIPVMDGGLFVLLILEAVQGRPLSLRSQQIIQTVGLAIILSIFLLVTYQDITRSLGHG